MQYITVLACSYNPALALALLILLALALHAANNSVATISVDRKNKMVGVV
jgi:hypothetical protein